MAENKKNSETWRIGLLFSQSGVTALIENKQRQGVLLAIDEINQNGGIQGRLIEVVSYDPESNPKKFRALAERLIDEDEIKIIFGCYMSSTRKAVLPIVEDRNALLFYPTLTEGFEFSKNVIYSGAAPNQNSVQLAHFLIENYGKRIYLVGSNYIYPYESNRIMTDLVKQMDGEIINEKYVSLDAQEGDFDQVIEDIKKTQPDAIFSTVVGSATRHFYQAYAAAGLDPAKVPIASLTTSEAEVFDMGVEIAKGHITSAPYFQSIDTPLNHSFVKQYKSKFGEDETITNGAEAAYFQTYLFAHALEITGNLRPDSIRENLLDFEYNAPQGKIKVDSDNNYTFLWPRIARVATDGQFEILAESVAAVKPDPYLVAPDVNDWSAMQFKVVSLA